MFNCAIVKRIRYEMIAPLSALILAVIFQSPAHATQLGGFTLILGGISTGSAFNHNVWFNTYIGSILLFSSPYDITNLPSSFEINLTPSDAAFAPAAKLLTDGVNENIKDFYSIAFNDGATCCGPSSSEAQGFFPGGGGPDFKGDTITSIQITVYNISGGANGTTGTLAYDESLVVNGNMDTPEPSAFWLTGVALVLVMGVRKRWFAWISDRASSAGWSRRKGSDGICVSRLFSPRR